MASVKVEGVKKVYDGDVVAVQEAHFDIADKEFVVLVGPSGCGKSTMLRMVAGLEEVSEGMIYIDGQVVNDVPPKDRDIAMVFQNYALYPHMTVYENMAFGLRLRKFSKIEIDRRVRDAAQILGIATFLDRKPKALSGGQRQRVAVGRAIVRKPKVFLFDEPLSNLDAKLRVQMRTEISKLHQQLGATMIYVTHDQVEAMTMGDKIVVMKDGVIQQIDTPLNLYNYPKNKFVGGFIGSPSMNFMTGNIVKDKGWHFRENGSSLKLRLPTRVEKKLRPYARKEVFFGIRPEHIYDARRSDAATTKARGKAKLEVVEPMGNELFLYITTESGNQYTARIDAAKEPAPRTTMDFVFDTSKAHFFDVETERVIE